MFVWSKIVKKNLKKQNDPKDRVGIKRQSFAEVFSSFQLWFSIKMLISEALRKAVI